MTKISDTQEQGLANLSLLAQRQRAEALALEEQVRQLFAVGQATLRKSISDQAHTLYVGGVPAKRIGAALGTKDYGTYRRIIDGGTEIAAPLIPGSGIATFLFPTPETMTVELEDWSDWTHPKNVDTLTGTATFELAEGQWLHTDYESGVGSYVERELFESDGSGRLRAEFDARMSR